MRIVLVLFSLVLSGCAINIGGKSDFEVMKETVANETGVYIDRFVKLYGGDTSKIQFMFTKLTKPTVGRCVTYENYEGKPTIKHIELDEDHWVNAEEETKEQLIFHELGHCALNRAHVTDKFGDDGVMVPRSIMFPSLIRSEWYLKYYNDYINELFNPIDGAEMIQEEAN